MIAHTFSFPFGLCLLISTLSSFRPGEARAWEESRGSGGVLSVLLPEFFPHLSLLAPGQPDVHHHQDGKHYQRKERRPLEQEPDHDQDKAIVLRGAHVCVGPVVASCCERCAL